MLYILNNFNYKFKYGYLNHAAFTAKVKLTFNKVKFRYSKFK